MLPSDSSQKLYGLSIVFYRSQFVHTATLRRIQNLNGLSIVFYPSHSTHTRRFDVYKTWMAWPSYFILHTPRTCDASTYTKLEWLVHRILSFTLRAHTTLRRIQNLNGLSIVFYCSHSVHTRRSDVYKTWMACPSYFIVHTPVTRDTPTYTSTTDKCGARSGLPQL